MITDRLVARTLPIEWPDDPIALAPDGDAYVWMKEGEGFVAWGEAARVDVGTGPDRFNRAVQMLPRLFSDIRTQDDTVPIAFASFTFDSEVPGSLVVVPEAVVGLRGGDARLMVVGPNEPRLETHLLPDVPKIRYAGSSISELEWLEAVDSAIAQIHDGRLEKVVLARDEHVWAKGSLDVRTLAHRLARRFPECYTFVCGGLVGATPELLVGVRGGAVKSLVLAGSAPRAANFSDDEAIGDALLRSEKDLEEHRLAFESVFNRLKERCSQLAWSTEPQLLQLANVQHLASSIQGELREPASALELAGLLHPSAAVCGTPTPAAMDLIGKLEKMDRGRYTGPVGWVDAAGNGEFGIALRCAQVAGSKARLFAGNGIVGASVPEAELEETRLKLRAMQSALEG